MPAARWQKDAMAPQRPPNGGWVKNCKEEVGAEEGGGGKKSALQGFCATRVYAIILQGLCPWALTRFVQS